MTDRIPTWEETAPAEGGDVPTWDSTQPAGGGYMSDVGHNTLEGLKEWPGAIRSIGDQVAKIAPGMMPGAMVQSGIERFQGKPVGDTPVGRTMDAVKGMAETFPTVIKGIGRDVGHIVETPFQLASGTPLEETDTGKDFRERPLSTATNIASVAVPALRGARKLFSGTPALAAEAGPSLFQRGAAKATSAMFGPNSEDVLARMKNPEAVKNAIPLTDISGNLVGSAKKLQEQIESASESARQLLRKGYEEDTPYNKGAGAFPKLGLKRNFPGVPSHSIESVIKMAKQNLGVYGGGVVGMADKKAIQILDGIQEDVNAIGKNVPGRIKSVMGVNSILKKSSNLPESTVGDIIRKLDANIDWSDESKAASNTALERVRTELDQRLKAQNKDYAKAMIPVDEKMRLMGDVKRQFNVSSVPGGDWQAGTATEGKLANLLGPNKSKTIETLERLKSHTGQDIHGQVKNFKTSQAFTGGRPNGARRVAFGTAVGTVIGKFLGSPAIGAITGSTIGLLADSYGGEMAGKIADVLANPKYEHYASTLNEAAAGGAKNLARVQAALKSSDPDYAAALGGGALSESKAREYLKQAKGDKSAARKLATADGWQF